MFEVNVCPPHFPESTHLNLALTCCVAQAPDVDRSDATLASTGIPGEHSMDPLEVHHVESRKSLATPDNVSFLLLSVFT